MYPHFQASLVVQTSACNVGDLGLIPGLGRYPGGEGTATYSSILAWTIPMDTGAWQATVHGVTESDTTEQLSTLTFSFFLYLKLIIHFTCVKIKKSKKMANRKFSFYCPLSTIFLNCESFQTLSVYKCKYMILFPFPVKSICCCTLVSPFFTDGISRKDLHIVPREPSH